MATGRQAPPPRWRAPRIEGGGTSLQQIEGAAVLRLWIEGVVVLCQRIEGVVVLRQRIQGGETPTTPQQHRRLLSDGGGDG